MKRRLKIHVYQLQPQMRVSFNIRNSAAFIFLVRTPGKQNLRTEENINMYFK